MKKAIIAALALLGAAAVTLLAGRGNIVIHYDRNGEPQEIMSSGGNCRHHLRAHPLDRVKMAGGESGDPNDCN